MARTAHVTDQEIAAMADTLLAAGLKPIFCVGETEAEREAGETEAVLRRQVSALPHDERLVIAYDDPVLAAPGFLSVGPDRLYLTVSQYESDIWVMKLKY